jgi:hypothetical protein
MSVVRHPRHRLRHLPVRRAMVPGDLVDSGKRARQEHSQQRSANQAFEATTSTHANRVHGKAVPD